MSLRRLVLPLAAVLTAVTAPAAVAADPYPVESPVFAAAVGAAVAYWGSPPCGGDVTYTWTDLAPGVVGYASWMRPSSAPTDPTRFSSCTIELDPAVGSPRELCTTMVHEMGHLQGREHVASPDDVMNATFSGELPVCTAAMAAFERPEVVEAAGPSAASVPAAPATAAPKQRPRHKRKRAAKRRSGPGLASRRAAPRGHARRSR